MTDDGAWQLQISMTHTSGYEPPVSVALAASGSGRLDCGYRAIRAGDYNLNVSFPVGPALLHTVAAACLIVGIPQG